MVDTLDSTYTLGCGSSKGLEAGGSLVVVGCMNLRTLASEDGCMIHHTLG